MSGSWRYRERADGERIARWMLPSQVGSDIDVQWFLRREEQAKRNAEALESYRTKRRVLGC